MLPPPPTAQLIDEFGSTDLLYVDVIWKLLQDKWKSYAKVPPFAWHTLHALCHPSLVHVSGVGHTGHRRMHPSAYTHAPLCMYTCTPLLCMQVVFSWIVFLNMFTLVTLSLSLCTSVDEVECDALFFLFVIPVPLHNLPAEYGDVCYCFTLFIAMWLALRRLVVRERLQRSFARSFTELFACALPWIALPLRFNEVTLPAHRAILGLASGLGWVRFMQDSFKFSSNLGPLVLMVSKIVKRDVFGFVAMFMCFFSTFMSMLWGIYSGCAPPSGSGVTRAVHCSHTPPLPLRPPPHPPSSPTPAVCPVLRPIHRGCRSLLHPMAGCVSMTTCPCLA